MRDAPLPIPSAAVGPAFRIGEVLDLGHSDWSTRPARMTTPTKGVRSLDPVEEPCARAAAFALALPDDVVFSHTTAARIHALPLPSILRRSSELHVMRHSSRPPIQRDECVSHRGLERREVAWINGMPVTSLADTWLDLIEANFRRIDLTDAVMMGDAVVEQHEPTLFQPELHPMAEPSTDDWWLDPATRGIAALRQRLMARRTFPGRRLAREALLFVRPRVWSPMESHARMVVVEVELPEPSLNAGVHWPDGGGFIGYGDLVWRRRVRQRVVGEYQGKDAHTEEESSRSTDNDRISLMRDAGWTVLELYSRHVTTRAGRSDFTRRVRALL